MNWFNIDLDSDYERSQNILDEYNFDTLLLEINCNMIEINEKEIRLHFERVLLEKNRMAREIFNANLANITKKAIEERGEI